MAGRAGKRLKCKEILPLLDQLLDKNLIVFDETGVSQRYRLSETVREYLRETYGHSAEGTACRIRHRKYFKDLAVQNEPRLLSDESKEATEALRREHDNLRLAIDNALHEEPEDALVLTGSLWRFWSRCGSYAEGRNSALDALERTRDLGDTIERAKAFHALGSMAWTLGELQEAEDAVKKGQAIYEAHGDSYHAAGCIVKLGNIVLDRSDFLAARNYYEQSLAIYRQVNDPERLCAVLNNIAILSMVFGDYDAALKTWNEAIEFANQAGNVNSLLHPRSNISELHLMRCEYDKAIVVAQEVLKAAEELGEEHLAAGSLIILGQVAHAKGESNDARTLLEVGVRRSDATGDLLIASEGWRLLSLVYFEMGDQVQAVDLLRKAMSGFHKLKARLEISRAFSAAGIIFADPRYFGAGARLRDEMGVILSPHEKRTLEPAVDGMRASMGDERFDADWRAGEAMSVDKAVGLILDF